MWYARVRAQTATKAAIDAFDAAHDDFARCAALFALYALYYAQPADPAHVRFPIAMAAGSLAVATH